MPEYDSTLAQRRTKASIMRGKEFRPSLQVKFRCLIESHSLVHTHSSPEPEFDFVFRERAKFARMSLKPDVSWSVRASHPVRQPMVELPRLSVPAGYP